MFPVINAIRHDDERAEIVRKPNLQKAKSSEGLAPRPGKQDRNGLKAAL
jgi:hypothetical protein